MNINLGNLQSGRNFENLFHPLIRKESKEMLTKKIKELEEIIDTPEHEIYNNLNFNKYNCIGIFHIYENGNPMNFEKEYLHYL